MIEGFLFFKMFYSVIIVLTSILILYAVFRPFALIISDHLKLHLLKIYKPFSLQIVNVKLNIIVCIEFN